MSTMIEYPRDQRIADLMSLLKAAKRCQHIIHKFADDPPTEWDARHADLDALLYSIAG